LYPLTRIKNNILNKSGSRNGKSKTGKPKAGRSNYSRGTPEKKIQEDQVRLNKYIAASGICSRREADQLITAGLVIVNGKTITELGPKVSPGDDVRYNGQSMKTEKKV